MGKFTYIGRKICVFFRGAFSKVSSVLAVTSLSITSKSFTPTPKLSSEFWFRIFNKLPSFSIWMPFRNYICIILSKNHAHYYPSTQLFLWLTSIQVPNFRDILQLPLASHIQNRSNVTNVISYIRSLGQKPF